MVEMSELLQLVVDEGVSDLHLEVGVAPVVRLHGEMQPLDLPPLTPEDTDALIKSIPPPHPPLPQRGDRIKCSPYPL